MAGEGSVVETDDIPLGNAGADGFDGEFRGLVEQEAHGVDLGVGDGGGFAVPEDAVQDGFVLQEGVALVLIHLGEEVAGEGGFGDAFPAVAPSHLGLDERAEQREAGGFQAVFGFLFVARFAIEGAPDGIAHVDRD